MLDNRCKTLSYEIRRISVRNLYLFHAPSAESA